MGQGSEGVDLLSGDTLATAQLIGSLGHEQTAGHVLKVGHHVVLDLGGPTQFPAVPSAAKNVRGLGEVFHAARHDGVGFTKFDHLGTGHNRLDARAANSREGEHGHLLGYTRLQPCMASTVDGL